MATILQSGLTQNGREEGIFDRIVDRIIDVVPLSVPASIEFRNETDSAIVVVLDNNRERKEIAPRGQAAFGNANVGDQPTLHVLNAAGQEVFARRIGTIGVFSNLGWNGGSF
jgi:hypothetical protein